MFLKIIIALIAIGVGLWVWNDERRTRKAIRKMANVQVKQFELQQRQYNNESTGAKWGR